MGPLRKKQPQIPARRNNTSASSARASARDLDERYAFRRNRTLTGSLASGVASVSEHRAELKSSRVHAHDLRRHRRKLSAILVGILIGSSALFALIYQSIAIVHIASTAPSPVDQSLYASKIQDYLTLHPLERFRFVVDSENLTNFMQKNGCPEVLRVANATAFDGLGATKFTLEFRQPAVSWSTGSTNLYVDESGNAFTHNYYPDPLVKVVDKTGIGTQDNQVLASTRFLGFIGMVIGKMKQYDMKVTSVTLPEATTRQIEINLENVPYPVKLSVDRPVGEQVEDASRAIRYLVDKGITPDYIDVRVSGRAFYK